jgi:hypothetical protein
LLKVNERYARVNRAFGVKEKGAELLRCKNPL